MVAPAAPARAASERSRETQERLLDAAERLFAARGFRGTSLRAVTRAAGASVSAAHYHFGSKEALLHATLRRRVEPVNRLRLAHLDALEREAGEGALAVEAIVDAFLRPSFEVGASDPERSGHYRQVAARLYSDPPELVAELKRRLFATVSARFTAAFARALPEADARAVALGFQLTVGVMVHVLAGHLGDAPGVDASALRLSDDALLDQMVAYVSAGVRALADPAAREATR